MNLRLDWASYESAKFACQHWHYSKCIPKSKLVKIGVWENEKFVGVIIFGVGATGHLLRPYGLKAFDGCELVRIALFKHETPVSRLISISIRMLKKENPKLRMIVSFADTGRNHHGGIYQASNWIYSGMTDPCKFPVIGGKITHPRTMSHLSRTDKKRQRSGVPHVIMPGKHRYLFPLDEKMRVKLEPLRKPYPKRAVSKDVVASGFHSEEGGSIPTTALQEEMW